MGDRQPILPGRGTSDYARYLRTDELLALQKPPSEMTSRDELLFQTVHQTAELWMKLACFEIEEATTLVGRGEIAPALRLVRRATTCADYITAQLHLLEHLSPWEYHEVRKALGHGSGFDSPGFSRIQEISPALGDAFGAALSAAGLDLVGLYRRGREFEELYQLAEQLFDWDEKVILFRQHHLKVIERIIGGHVIGTQGTPVEVLAERVEHRFFPELWKVRDELTRIADEEGSRD
jgi:tryptophan 2,3-dioxygenase